MQTETYYTSWMKTKFWDEYVNTVIFINYSQLNYMLPFKIKDVKPRCNNSEQKFWIMWPLMGMQLPHFWQKLVWNVSYSYLNLFCTWCEVMWAHSRLGLIHDSAKVQDMLKFIINRLCLQMMAAINYGQSGKILGNHLWMCEVLFFCQVDLAVTNLMRPQVKLIVHECCILWLGHILGLTTVCLSGLVVLATE
jgi:hypothetical protein